MAAFIRLVMVLGILVLFVFAVVELLAILFLLLGVSVPGIYSGFLGR